MTLAQNLVRPDDFPLRVLNIDIIPQVTQINWSSTAVPLVASGIQFAPANRGSARYTATARREVILAAGAIQTPALLQLSGIGDSAILGKLGITTLIDLKTVGRNLQEQVRILITCCEAQITNEIRFPRR